jgi:hypothetical protein
VKWNNALMEQVVALFLFESLIETIATPFPLKAISDHMCPSGGR